MILKKEFYFVRHGQTDHNLLDADCKKDHPEETPLNETGRRQAEAIAPIIKSLPIQTVCVSPTVRTQETKKIITHKMPAQHYAIEELTECTHKVWKDMSFLGMYSVPPADGEVRYFMDRVCSGINQALSLPGPTLIVAHGGIHWAICCLMGIENYAWVIGNCEVVHFAFDTQGQWTGSRISSKHPMFTSSQV